jgi:hypothetical protein
LLQRVGGRAGTAVPQGAVCELPNPLLSPSHAFSGLNAVSGVSLKPMAFAMHQHD